MTTSTLTRGTEVTAPVGPGGPAGTTPVGGRGTTDPPLPRHPDVLPGSPDVPGPPTLAERTGGWRWRPDPEDALPALHPGPDRATSPELLRVAVLSRLLLG